jgi:hypothetical protein
MPTASEELVSLLITLVWTCLGTSSWINPLFRHALPSLARVTELFALAGFEFVPDLLDVLRASSPPSISWFESLSTVVPRNVWGIYAVVLKKPSHPDLLYIGSATASNRGARARFQEYQSGKNLPQGVKNGLANGYKITHHTILAWCPIPSASWIPVLRYLVVALEAVFACVFWAMASKKRSYGYVNECLWSLDSFSYTGACSHSSLTEPVEGDLSLSAEDLEQISKATREKNREYQRDYSKQQRVQATPKFKQQQKARNAKQYPKTRARQLQTLADQTFHCDVCDVTSPDNAAWLIHVATPRHIRWSEEGEKGPYCRVCDKSFRYPSDLKAHEKRQCHLDALTAQSAI